MQKYIDIKGARENNLKNIDIKIPKDKLIVMTGLSGSGKTSLAFDTIYAEGQRRYVESLSAYARMFLGGVEKPDVDSIEGLSPAISIDQKTTSKNPRSTVGTVTEIYDYLRLLYARIGHAICPEHKVEISAQTIPQIIEKIYEYKIGAKVVIMAPVAVGQKGTHEKTLELIRKEGYVRARIDSEMYDLSDDIKLDKNQKHTIEVVIDRIKIRDDLYSRLFSSLEIALKLGEGKVLIEFSYYDDLKGEDVTEEKLFSEHLACPYCDFSIPKLEPRMFSFNSPFGACETCNGLGVLQTIDIDLLVTNPEKSINDGAIRYFKNIAGSENVEWQVFEKLADFYDVDLDKPFNELTPFQQEVVLYGSKEPISYEINTTGGMNYRRRQYIEGVVPLIERRFKTTTSNMSREYYNSYLKDTTCPTCHGSRLSKYAMNVFICGKNIGDFCELTICDALNFIQNLQLSESEAKIADLVIKEIVNRLTFLQNVGLEYLTLSRASGTLSGGESQRIRLATQIGSHLTGVLYVLDEPSIGLHQKDNAKLIGTLKKMRDLGNTLIVVEHDEEIMKEADFLVDIGPRAGVHGGEVVALGTPEEVMKVDDSITGQYLSKKKVIEVPTNRRSGNGKSIIIKGARENNLKNIDVEIPLGEMVVVTGVSGSGKSTLVNEILGKTLHKRLYKANVIPGACDEVLGIENIDRVIDVNQSPIGRTPRSNPATYTGTFDLIRDLYASTNDAKIRGYNKGRFSFNVKGGRCERCQGDGLICIEMHFLPNVYIPCEECHGSRYNKETLEVKYRGKNIADVLDMTVEESVEFFDKIPSIKQRLQTINEVGLGYVKLGQSATTLSGGEAQRVKLASELYKKITNKTLYILDEPTTGLHSDDVKRLLEVLNYIVDQGATVLIIEHNLDVIKQADHIIDLGPDGGNNGGMIVAQGTPEEVCQVEGSYTGEYLKKVL